VEVVVEVEPEDDHHHPQVLPEVEPEDDHHRPERPLAWPDSRQGED
jgi:hypothetical protein